MVSFKLTIALHLRSPVYRAQAARMIIVSKMAGAGFHVLAYPADHFAVLGLWS